MIFILCLLVSLAAVGLLGLGLFMFYRESRATTGSVPMPDHHMKILGVLDFSSNRLSLLFIAAGVVLLGIGLPGSMQFSANPPSWLETQDAAERRLRSELARLVPTNQRSNWIMSFTSCVVVRDEHARLTHYLAGLGFQYVVGHSHARASRTPNLATQSTVYYYHSGAKPVADTLANMLAIQTGSRFSTTQGDGNGVPSERRRHAIFVHWVTGTCTSAD